MADRESHETVIDAPPDIIMGVITDFEAYPEWAQNIKDVEIRERDTDGRASQVWYRVDARVLELSYVLAYYYHDGLRLTWDLAEGAELTQLDGEYLLTPEGERTRVRYTLEVEIAFPLPGFLKKRAAKQIIETGLGELKRRAEALA